MKEFIIPPLPKYDVVSGVYKMVFDDGSYYIGSSINLKQRFWGWKFKLSAGIDKNYKVTAAFKLTTKVVFEIIEITSDPVFRRMREDGYIKVNFGKPLCLNISPDAFTNKGVRQNPNKKVNKSNFHKTVRINDIGQIVETFESVSAAQKKYNTNDINECFKNSHRKVKGMIFRKIDTDGNIIPAPTPPSKEWVTRKRKGFKYSEATKKSMREKIALRKLSPDYVPPKLPQQTKKIYQYSEQGDFIKEHLSISAAAKAFNADSRNFKRQIKSSPRNYYKGFIWKYA